MTIIFEEIDGTGADLFTPHPYVKKIRVVEMANYKAKKTAEERERAREQAIQNIIKKADKLNW